MTESQIRAFTEMMIGLRSALTLLLTCTCLTCSLLKCNGLTCTYMSFRYKSKWPSIS